MKYNFCANLTQTKRVDMYISALFVDFSRSYVQRLIDGGSVRVNNNLLKKNTKIQHRDEIVITITAISVDILPENIPLDIVYEDENILVINKKAGMNVHPVPGEGGNSGTLVNAIMYHCKNGLPTISGEQRPGIVHRLDKDTSGVIMVAKNDSMMHYLSDIIRERKIDKYYLAVVGGIVKEKELKIESYIGRDKHNRIKMTAIDPINPKIAISFASVLGYIDNQYTVLKVKIETGRTHQIRVHLASIGFPILGDTVYGNSKVNSLVEKKYGLKRQALHAHILELELYGKQKKFEGALKSDMIQLIGNITL